jgi:hypothetical protein
VIYSKIPGLSLDGETRVFAVAVVGLFLIAFVTYPPGSGLRTYC